jgi:predicted RNA binding protein YcfA (HicA-like mRNA interferase family)
MPRLRRLSGAEVIRILEDFGFEIISVKGSHHKLRRVINQQKQTLHIPVHGSRPMPTGTLRSIYKQACAYIPEEELRPHFYTD